MGLKIKSKNKAFKPKLRKGDRVIVLAGKDKGRQGSILVMKGERVQVSGVQMVKKHTKPNPNKNEQGGIVEQEGWIAISNVAILNSQTNKADKIGFKMIGEDKNKKVRCYRSTGELIDAKG